MALRLAAAPLRKIMPIFFRLLCGAAHITHGQMTLFSAVGGLPSIARRTAGRRQLANSAMQPVQAAMQPCNPVFSAGHAGPERARIASRDGYDAYSMQPESFGGAGPGTDESITPVAIGVSLRRPGPVLRPGFSFQLRHGIP